MKAHLTKLSLALLSTVFLLGCQEQGSEPVGPEGLGPEFAAKTCEENPNQGKCKGDDPDTGGDNPGSPHYEYTFAGDITTDPTTPGANRSKDDVYLHSCCREGNEPEPGVDDEKLDLSKLLMDVPEAEACFGIGPFDWNGFGWLSTNNQVVNEVEARFLFDALDKGGKEIRYYLTLDGNVTETTDVGDGIFPPEVDETTKVTFTTFSIGPQRNKEKNACSGAGDLPVPGTSPTSVLLLGTLEDPDLI